MSQNAHDEMAQENRKMAINSRSRPNPHNGRGKGIEVCFPEVPNDPIPLGRSAPMAPVQIGGEAVPEPPAPAVQHGTVAAEVILVVVIVDRREGRAVMIRHPVA